MPWFCHPEPPGVRNWLPQNSEIPTDLRSTSVYTVGPYQTTLPHCFLIPATKTFSLTPVPLKLLSNTCSSSFFFKGLNGLITQSHSCSSKTLELKRTAYFSQIRHYLNDTDIVWSSSRLKISTMQTMISFSKLVGLRVYNVLKNQISIGLIVVILGSLTLPFVGLKFRTQNVRLEFLFTNTKLK